MHVKTPREVHATALATVLLVPLVLLAALACGGATTSGTSASSAGTTPASASPSSSVRQTAPANGTAPAPPASAVATFAGPLSGTDALVYLLAEGTTVNGYVCDVNEGKGDLSEWFATASSNGTFTTTSKNGVKVTGSVAGQGLNILSVEHHREGVTVGVDEVEVLFTVETRDPAHRQDALDAMRAQGHRVDLV